MQGAPPPEGIRGRVQRRVRHGIRRHVRDQVIADEGEAVVLGDVEGVGGAVPGAERDFETEGAHIDRVSVRQLAVDSEPAPRIVCARAIARAATPLRER